MMFCYIARSIKFSHALLSSRSESIGSAIVFTRTRDTSNRISLLLRQFLTTPVITLNGDMPQAQRLGALAKFKRLPMSCLVATDVAARLVILRSLPHCPFRYV